MILRKRYRKVLVILGVVLLSFTAGFVTNLYAPLDQYFEISKNIDIFTKLYREVHTYYVDDVDPNKFMRTGIDAMLRSLDPYTVFISSSEIEDYEFMTTGQYAGIGADITKLNNKIVIIEPFDNSPAQKMDLRAGDEIVEVNGKSIEGRTSREIQNLLRGQPGTEVTVGVRRYGEKNIITKNIIREDIKVKNVPYFGMIDDETGYIKLTGFTMDASREVRNALSQLKKNNNAKKIIMDLRGNPGGLLYEAVAISNLFVQKDELIVETRGRIPDAQKTYRATGTPLDTNIPLVILTDNATASAAEIVSGCIQDLDRGIIVGGRTFGKGLVQTQRPLSYNTQMKITTQKYYVPSGRCIQALDYAHRNPDGSVNSVPDSLKKAFKTHNGRTVYDGGGIEPDSAVSEEEDPVIITELIKKNIVFDYATKFRSGRDSISSAKYFKITNEIYDDFKKFVSEQGFDYFTSSEQKLKDLEETAKNELYYNAIKDQLRQLAETMKHDKNSDLEKFRNKISELLTGEIVSRYYFQSGRIEASFNTDKDIRAAFYLLQETDKYNKILARAK